MVTSTQHPRPLSSSMYRLQIPSAEKRGRQNSPCKSLLNPHYLSEGSINGCIITPEQLLVCVCVLFFKVLCFSRGGNKQCACSQKASILNSPNGFLVRRAILSSVLYASWCSNCYCTSKLIHTYIHKENKGNCRTCVSTGG